MTEPIRWGVLGASKFAREQMARAIHAAQGAELAALGTSSADKAAPFSAFAPGLRVHDGYDAVLADPDIDAVYIPLPHHLHAPWALKAIAAGKHVLVEKPLGLRTEDFDPVIAARDASGLVVAEAYMIVHHPQWQRAKALLEEGAIGQLAHVRAAFCYNNAADAGNIRNRPDIGGGSIPDIGVYTFGSVRLVTGQEPLSVISDITREDGLEVTARVAATFPGFSFQSMTSMRMGAFQEVVFHGDTGAMRLSAPFNPGVYGEARIDVMAEGAITRTERFPAANHYVLQVENFCDAIRGKTAFRCPLEFSRGTQAMIDMVWAAETG
ncbi:MAG: Gfo/Idh/MocA family oxidoreductase [Pseudomonadota bacterium]